MRKHVMLLALGLMGSIFVVKAQAGSGHTIFQGAVVRGDSTEKKIALVFTGDTFGEGSEFIRHALKKEAVKASFFFTGNYYRQKAFKRSIKKLKRDEHYLGAHSDKHLLYNDWQNRQQLLVDYSQWEEDIANNYREMQRFGIKKNQAYYFLPPYEWYNDTIAQWTKQWGLQLINFTSGTLSHADYTHPEEKNYRSSQEIWESIFRVEQERSNGLNGFILLLHIGTDTRRTDKFYKRLPMLLKELISKGYRFVTVADLLN